MQAKTLTFNLCDYDLLNLSFVNRKGVVLHWLFFNRAFPTLRDKKAKRETPETVQEVGFRAYSATRRPTSLQTEFRTKQAPRKPDAKDHEQAIKLAGYSYNKPLQVFLTDKDGAHVCAFYWHGHHDQASVNIHHEEDDSLHALTLFPPEKKVASKRGWQPMNKRPPAKGKGRTTRPTPFNLRGFENLEVEFINHRGELAYRFRLDREPNDGATDVYFEIVSLAQTFTLDGVIAPMNPNAKKHKAKIKMPKGERFDVDFVIDGQRRFVVQLNNDGDDSAAWFTVFDVSGHELSALSIARKGTIDGQ